MDTASLIIGIICVVVGFIPCLQLLVIVPAIVGLILGIIAYRRNKEEGKPAGIALTGIILNILPLLTVTGMAIFIGLSSDAYSIGSMTIK
ncbi:hypothetical protein CSA37_10970 [Candidatus Fermentibacteria bacterium]|nr:MAG: hypothetical protein CSA37_10970 [Candidatus Fermentibacteria bacterium]